MEHPVLIASNARTLPYASGQCAICRHDLGRVSGCSQLA